MSNPIPHESLPPSAGIVAVSPLPAVLGVAALGALLVLMAGFAPIASIHNAAHDSRHSYAMPCH